MRRILFLCTGNSCRSQMAEGFARARWPDLEVFSAGIEAHGLNPHAVTVMAEKGIDISGQHSKTVEALLGIDFQWIITVCDHAAMRCPQFSSGAENRHVSFEDPPKLAIGLNEDEALDCYRRVRDEVSSYVNHLF